MSGPPVRVTVTIANERGMHARPAARFVECAGKFSADIQVTRSGVTVSGRSIMGLLMLGAVQGAEIEIEAAGPDAEAAATALAELVRRGFDDA
ncbi:MAG: HPr family phosphocarrier protein [Alphaproteobacteria bacterium]